MILRKAPQFLGALLLLQMLSLRSEMKKTAPLFRDGFSFGDCDGAADQG